MQKRKITKKRYNRYLNEFFILKNLYRRKLKKIFKIKGPFYTRDGRRI